MATMPLIMYAPCKPQSLPWVGQMTGRGAVNSVKFLGWCWLWTRSWHCMASTVARWHPIMMVRFLAASNPLTQLLRRNQGELTNELGAWSPAGLPEPEAPV
jgi:hypothetical protein